MEYNSVKLILLDFDGTLADTRMANALAYEATFAEAGYPLSAREYLDRYFGIRCNEFLTLYGITSPEERERLRLRKIELYPSFFDSVRLNEPLWSFCCQFRRQGGRVWIVSTGSRANIDNAMRHLGIGIADHTLPDGERAAREAAYPRGCVDGVLSGADATHSKPDPECFLEVMRREGCSPRETLIFEDSRVGLEAAERSGASYFKVDTSRF